MIAVASGKPGDLVLASSDSSNEEKTDATESSLTNKNKEIRIVAVGSSTFAANFGAAQQAQNKDLFVNIANYLLQDEDFISIRPKDLNKGSIDLTQTTANLYLLFIAFIYPFMFLGGGVWFWLRRRRL